MALNDLVKALFLGGSLLLGTAEAAPKAAPKKVAVQCVDNKNFFYFAPDVQGKTAFKLGSQDAPCVSFSPDIIGYASLPVPEKKAGKIKVKEVTGKSLLLYLQDTDAGANPEHTLVRPGDQFFSSVIDGAGNAFLYYSKSADKLEYDADGKPLNAVFIAKYPLVKGAIVNPEEYTLALIRPSTSGTTTPTAAAQPAPQAPYAQTPAPVGSVPSRNGLALPAVPAGHTAPTTPTTVARPTPQAPVSGQPEQPFYSSLHYFWDSNHVATETAVYSDNSAETSVKALGRAVFGATSEKKTSLLFGGDNPLDWNVTGILKGGLERLEQNTPQGIFSGSRDSIGVGLNLQNRLRSIAYPRLHNSEFDLGVGYRMTAIELQDPVFNALTDMHEFDGKVRLRFPSLLDLSVYRLGAGAEAYEHAAKIDQKIEGTSPVQSTSFGLNFDTQTRVSLLATPKERVFYKPSLELAWVRDSLSNPAGSNTVDYGKQSVGGHFELGASFGITDALSAHVLVRALSYGDVQRTGFAAGVDYNHTLGIELSCRKAKDTNVDVTSTVTGCRINLVVGESPLTRTEVYGIREF